MIGKRNALTINYEDWDRGKKKGSCHRRTAAAITGSATYVQEYAIAQPT